MRIKTWSPPNLQNGTERDWEPPRFSAFVYVIGVLLWGDGSVFAYRSRSTLVSGEVMTYYSYAIQLQVSDLEFATHFNSKCSLALGHPTVSIRGPDRKGMFFVTYRDQSFGKWWTKQTLATLRPYIERCPLDYLRGRFDSDANVHAYSVALCGAESH